ncbi:MAG TPA: ABC transporter ATP-binding protein [Candidatus Binatia bacterium]|jgi:ABC-type nitrate/sulfonate/bicarbonate transport system ATPase subunit
MALQDVSFEVAENEFLCILGPSGCGKSTILNVLSGLETVTAGDVTIHGRDRSSQPLIGYIFQEPRLLPWLTARENVKFAVDQLHLPPSESEARIRESLELVALSKFSSAYPHELSGGMQQRIAIARALAVDPHILLMDEPFSSLDEITARGMRKLLLELWEQRKKTIMFVTHNMFEAAFLSDRILLMTRHPGTIYKAITTGLPRPRDYEDPKIFAVSTKIARDFLREIGDERAMENDRGK